MIRPQYTLDLHDELIVDNFAGGGGYSTGVELALGRHVDHAVNHSREALGMHRINHPQTIHHCEDVWRVNPDVITEGRRVGYAHFSPDCTDFSKAKGGKPLRKNIRGLAWVMVKWARARTAKPRVMSLENVEEFEFWGPLLADGTRCRRRIGKTFRSLVTQLRNENYAVEWRCLRGSDYGAPTIRRRLFLIARCDGKPIVWPAATHADPKTGTGLKPWRTIAECIEWDRPCPSIFLTKAQARAARCRRPLAKSTLRRIAMGVDRYVLKAKEPFLVSVTHQGDDRMQSANEPIRTITAAHRGEKALVSPVMIPRYDDRRRGRKPRSASANEPIQTITGGGNVGVMAQAHVAPFLTEHANASTQRNFPIEEPMRTQCGQVKGGHFALVAPTIVNTCNGKFDSAPSRARDAREPLPVVTATQKYAVVAANMVKLRGDPKTHPGNEVSGPAHTMSAAGQHHGLVAAHLTKFNTGSVGSDLNAPLPTITAGNHAEDTHGGAATVHGVVGAFLAQHNGGFNATPGHPATEPVSTISAKGSQQQVVAGSLIKYYSTDQDPRLDEPAHSVTTRDRFGAVESTVVAPMTPDQIEGARRVAKFLRAHGVKFEGEFATVCGFVIVDIGMRMLAPRELFRAQGFPENYVIDRAWVINPKTGELLEIRLTKEQQIRMCGNSVCPPIAEALVRANVPELAAWYRRELKPRRRRVLA